MVARRSPRCLEKARLSIHPWSIQSIYTPSSQSMGIPWVIPHTATRITTITTTRIQKSEVSREGPFKHPSLVYPIHLYYYKSIHGNSMMNPLHGHQNHHHHHTKVHGVPNRPIQESILGLSNPYILFQVNPWEFHDESLTRSPESPESPLSTFIAAWRNVSRNPTTF
jgi:hypothetical protein